jgi:hypothetical protein
MSIPIQPVKYLEAEITHIKNLQDLIVKGWELPGIRLVDKEDRKNGKVLTLFPTEQSKLIQTLSEICSERLKELELQLIASKT